MCEGGKTKLIKNYTKLKTKYFANEHNADTAFFIDLCTILTS